MVLFTNIKAKSKIQTEHESYACVPRSQKKEEEIWRTWIPNVPYPFLKPTWATMCEPKCWKCSLGEWCESNKAKA